LGLKADQILTLIKSHIEGDEERFPNQLLLRFSALEAKAGTIWFSPSINELIKFKAKAHS